MFKKHDMEHLYEMKIRPINNNRWYPKEVFQELEKDDYEELCDCGRSYYEDHICAYK